MKMILLVAALALVAGFGQANAAVAVSSVAVTQVIVISTPTTGTYNVLRGCHLANDTATALCVHFAKGYTTNYLFSMCAAAYSTSDTPSLGNSNAAAPQNGLASWFGEEFALSNDFIVTSSTPGAKGAGGITITCDYLSRTR